MIKLVKICDKLVLPANDIIAIELNKDHITVTTRNLEETDNMYRHQEIKYLLKDLYHENCDGGSVFVMLEDQLRRTLWDCGEQFVGFGSAKDKTALFLHINNFQLYEIVGSPDDERDLYCCLAVLTKNVLNTNLKKEYAFNYDVDTPTNISLDYLTNRSIAINHVDLHLSRTRYFNARKL